MSDADDLILGEDEGLDQPVIPGTEEQSSQAPLAPQSNPTPASGPARKEGAPATTTDLARFPEVAPGPEVTSVVVPDPVSPRVAAGIVPALQGDLLPERRSLPSFDPQLEILRKLGSGGMGEVFLGIQKPLDRQVAVKRIRELGDDEKSAERFVREAKAQSVLQHPGIAQVYDLRQAGGELFLIMEYVQGRTLEEILDSQGKFSPDRIVEIGVQLTQALENAAHEGYIHRDLKPGNVMVTENGKVKIIDFGLAHRFKSLIKNRLTETGAILGTPAYMSPEQLNEEDDLDIRSDIWSLGSLLYALATGDAPFTGNDFVCTVKNVLLADPTPLTILEKEFPPGLWQVLAKALRKERADRWQDYAAFRHALLHHEDLASGAPAEETRPPTSPAAGSPPVSRRRTLGVALGASALLVAGGILISQLVDGPKPHGGNAAPSSADAGRSAKSPSDSPAALNQSKKPPVPEIAKEDRSRPIGTDAKQGETIESPKVEPSQKAAPPPLRLRDKLLASPLTPGAIQLLEDLLLRFESHYGELGSFSYESLRNELSSSGKDGATKANSDATAEEKEFFVTYRRAAEKFLGLAKGALQARREELRSSKGPVTLKLRAGGTIAGTVEDVNETAITLKDQGGSSATVPLEKISPEEFLPKAAPGIAELAFQALSISAARALPSLLDLEDKDEELILWLPFILRLARLEVEAKARQTATEAKPLLLENRAPDSSTACQLSRAAAQAAEDVLEKNAGRMPAAYGFLAEDFDKAKRELAALELLLNRQFSRAAAVYRTTSSAPIAAALLLELFEKDLAAASDELLEGSGWFNWRWELRPTHPDVKERMKFLIPKPDENIVVLQDPEGPRSLVMNDITSRASEGVLLRLRLDALGNRPDEAEWRFRLLSENEGSTYLRVDRDNVGVFRSTLTPGASDVRLAQAALPSLPVAQTFRTFALVPSAEHLHVYVDRQLVLSVPREDGAIPKQLAIVVLHAKIAVRNLQARRASATDGGSRK